jgi:hypothetical protein
MISKDIRQLIDDVIKSCDPSVTTDWLAYCLLKSNINLLEEKEIVVQRSIKSGIPSVGTKTLIDNDCSLLKDSQSNTSGADADRYKLLYERHEFTICIEIIQDVYVDETDHSFIHIKIQQYFISFDNPDNQ